MQVAVLGGTGFIGRQVAARLLRRGITPVAIARGRHPVDLPQGTVFEAADRMNTGELAAILQRHGIETVIDIFALGLRNTAPVFRAMSQTGGRYLLLSSVDVYRNYGGLLRRETPPIQSEPARETDPLRDFRYPYRANSRRPQGVEDDLFDDYDKIILEETALADKSFTTTAIRAPMIFGPGDKQHRFRWAIEAVRQCGVIQVDARAADWPNSYGYAVDVAEAIATAALDPRAAGRIYNVGQPFVRTPVAWLETFARAMNTAITVQRVGPEAKGLLHERADASDLRYPLTLDTTRIRHELGFVEPTPEAEALAATIAYELESTARG